MSFCCILIKSKYGCPCIYRLGRSLIGVTAGINLYCNLYAGGPSVIQRILGCTGSKGIFKVGKGDINGVSVVCA
jgi:hypothetical protein